ncbi:MAG: enoyl-CoA hydratase-related protein [Desulfatiglandales bacterium]|jgi:2-(1,2-epoxy-1,2-dihydrophenyl)acetyl-CoA isomerase|nr:enoyl-CoA hydratase-related protein [Desulfatiglandales bacterium]
MGYKSILLKRESGVATIVMNRPGKMNGVDQEMCKELVAATEEVARDAEVRVVILTGTGKAFCAGGDLDSTIYDIKDPQELRDIILSFGQVSINLRNMLKPAIAMVNGVAVGAGFSFALACDIIMASDRARFGHVYLNIGVQSDCGATYFLPRLIGVARACELIFTGNIIDAAEAERIGLVNRVVPAEELETGTMELALSLTKGPALAMGLAKKSIYQGLTMDLASAIEFETRAHVITMISDDMTEGITAFKEKRTPKFK